MFTEHSSGSFSYNDESKINPILLDRMVTIKVEGYKEDEKLIISKDFLIPKIYKKLNMNTDTVNIDDENIKYIIEKYTDEEGVRGLNKCFDSIFSKLNVLLITDDEDILPYKINAIKNKPIKINKEIIDLLLDDKSNDKAISIEFMYM